MSKPARERECGEGTKYTLYERKMLMYFFYIYGLNASSEKTSDDGAKYILEMMHRDTALPNRTSKAYLQELRRLEMTADGKRWKNDSDINTTRRLKHLVEIGCIVKDPDMTKFKVVEGKEKADGSNTPATPCTKQYVNTFVGTFKFHTPILSKAEEWDMERKFLKTTFRTGPNGRRFDTTTIATGYNAIKTGKPIVPSAISRYVNYTISEISDQFRNYTKGLMA